MKTIFTFCLLIFLICQGNFISAFPGAPMISVHGKGDLNEKGIPEKIMVQTDREVYIAGETMFFKTDLVVNSSSQNQQSDFCYLLLRDKNTVFNQMLIKLNQGSFSGSIYLPDTLKTGLYEVVGFTNYQRNFGESFFNRKQIVIINRFDKQLESINIQSNESHNQAIDSLKKEEITNLGPYLIHLVKDSFHTREKIAIQLSIADSSRLKLKDKVSVSVKELNPYSLSQIKNELKLQGSHPTQTTPDVLPYLREKNNLYIKGKAVKNDQTPLANITLFLATSDTIANLVSTQTDSLGKFTFILGPYYFGKNLIIKPKDILPENNNAMIVIENKFAVLDPLKVQIPTMTPENRKYIISSQNLVQIQKMYSVKSFHNTEVKPIKPLVPVVYSIPTTVTYPADFVPLKNLDELCVNIFQGVKLKKDKNGYNLYVYDYLTNQFFDTPTTVFMDGIPIDYINPLLNFSSTDIFKLEVCKIARTKGNLEFPGIISMITTKKKFDPSTIQPSWLKYTCPKIVEPTEFYSPSYSNLSIATPAPDFRQLMYWNPEISLTNGKSASIEFNASDWFSDYLIEVTGLTQDGNTVKSYKKIKIYH